MHNWGMIGRKLSKRFQMFKKHPLTTHKPYQAMHRYISLNISFLFKKQVIYQWTYGLQLWIKKGDAGLVGNIYYGLYEYKESIFLLHFLRKEDSFVDIGANLGHYSLLTTGIIGNNTIAIEPFPDTFYRLKEQITLNKLNENVVLHNCGVSNTSGTLYLSDNRGVMNHIVPENHSSAISIPVKTMDDLTQGNAVTCIKMDVEGYEMQALKGATQLLKSNDLKVIIIELNHSGKRYNVTNEEIAAFLKLKGFNPYAYNPFKRELLSLTNYDTSQFNTVFIKDIDAVNHRIADAPSFQIMGYEF